MSSLILGDASVPACSKTHFNKSRKGRIAPLFPLEFVLSKDLMRAILHKGLKVDSVVHEDVADVVNDVGRLLPLVQGLCQTLTDAVQFEDIPEHLRDKVFFPIVWDGGAFSNAFDPHLQRRPAAPSRVSPT